MSTVRCIKRLARAIFKSDGHGSCYPFVKKPSLDVPSDRGPSEFAQELLTKAKDSAESEVKKLLSCGRIVDGLHDGRPFVVWLDVTGTVQCAYTYDAPVKVYER
jgi:hypothetical protein